MIEIDVISMVLNKKTSKFISSIFFFNGRMCGFTIPAPAGVIPIKLPILPRNYFFETIVSNRCAALLYLASMGGADPV